MEYLSAVAEWGNLTARQQAYRCRLMAKHVQELAEAAPLQTQETYIKLAIQWLTVAQEIQLLEARNRAA